MATVAKSEQPKKELPGGWDLKRPVEEKPPRKRTLKYRYFVYPRFQLTLIFLNLVLILIVMIIMAGQVAQSFEYSADMGSVYNLSPDHPFIQFLQAQMSQLLQKLVLTGIVTMSISIIVTLIVSHKLVGPIFRLRRYFQDIISTGTFTPIKFRRGDYQDDLAEIINKALETLNAMEKKE